MRRTNMKSIFVKASTAAFLLLIVMLESSNAEIDLSIQDITHEDGMGSFVVFANPDQDYSIGTYSVNLLFDSFQSVNSLTVDTFNLIENMEEAGPEFGTTAHPAEVSEGGIMQFVGFGLGLLPSNGAPLMKVDFSVNGPFDAGSSFAVSTIAANPADLVTGISYVANQPLTFDLKQISGVGEPCDVNSNGICDAGDIDFLSKQVVSGDANLDFDLNADGKLNDDDRMFWINDLMNTYPGDSNLDLVFDTTDLVAIFAAGEYEDTIVGNSTWATGDWNGDMEFSTSDLTYAFSAGGFELGPRGDVHSVPEPTSIAILILPILTLLGLRNQN